jgi:hypothetical protein
MHSFGIKILLDSAILNGSWAIVVIQGCQMVYFQTKNPNLGNFWSVLK